MAGSRAEADGGMEVYVPVQPQSTERSHRDSWFVFMFDGIKVALMLPWNLVLQQF